MNNFRNSSRPTPQELHLSGRCRFLQMSEEIPLSVSAFTIGLLDVNGVKCAVMVHNTEERRPDGSLKPPGWGIPGGGVNRPGESPEESAVREFMDETGLQVENAKWERYEHSLLTPRPGGFNYLKCHLSAGVPIVRGMRQTLVHVFTADIIWEGLVAEELGKLFEAGEDLVLDLTPEKGETLGIKEAQTGEIDAIGLFPIDELISGEGEGFYKSHLHRLRLALEPYMVGVSA